MVTFERFKLELHLEAQMPMIHFQSGQCGATIRASEVKPKLDSFLLAKLSRETKKCVAELKKDKNYRGIFLDAKSDTNDALDYKLQITVTEPSREVDLGKKRDKQDLTAKNECYSMYYANTGKSNPKDIVYGIFSNPTVTVICFKEKLRHYIEENIEKFFLVTNFGTMQNKGFGSFAPVNWCPDGELNEKKIAEVARAYQELISGGICYAMVFDRMPEKNAAFVERNAFCAKMSETIKSFYGIMKSGQNLGERGYARSFLYEYAHEVLKLGNEKAWMKKTKIAPKVNKPGNEKKSKFGSEEYRYLRAFLGIGDQIEYGTGYNEKGYIEKNPLVKVSISSVNKRFERLSSPIYFKVIRNVVLIAAFEVPEELYGAKFVFSGEEYKKDKGKRVLSCRWGKGTIQVPMKEELKNTGAKFDIQDFLARYVTYYNGDLRYKIKSLKSAPQVKAVRIDA